jgi:hypothetical protein
VLWRWNQHAHNHWYSFVKRGFRGEGVKSRAWLRARVAQMMLKRNQQPDDYVTEEEDEMLDFMQEGGERYGRFLRELSAPDDEGDEINVHKYGWGDPEGYVAQCWIELEQQHLEDKEAAESLASEIAMSRSL